MNLIVWVMMDASGCFATQKGIYIILKRNNSKPLQPTPNTLCSQSLCFKSSQKLEFSYEVWFTTTRGNTRALSTNAGQGGSYQTSPLSSATFNTSQKTCHIPHSTQHLFYQGDQTRSFLSLVTWWLPWHPTNSELPVLVTCFCCPIVYRASRGHNYVALHMVAQKFEWGSTSPWEWSVVHSVDEGNPDISAEAYLKLISALECTENCYKCTGCLLNI